MMCNDSGTDLKLRFFASPYQLSASTQEIVTLARTCFLDALVYSACSSNCGELAFIPTNIFLLVCYDDQT